MIDINMSLGLFRLYLTNHLLGNHLRPIIAIIISWVRRELRNLTPATTFLVILSITETPLEPELVTYIVSDLESIAIALGNLPTGIFSTRWVVPLIAKIVYM
jgi:hypothetical protein